MNVFNNIQLENFYLVRVPLLSIEELFKFNAKPSKQEQIDMIKKFFNDPLIGEAIYIASPDLYEEYKNLVSDKINDEKQHSKTVKSIYKYIIRMSTRPTPYGLFAGCASGSLGDETKILLSAKTKIKKYKRLDMNYVAELVSYISKLPEIKKELLFYVNNSIYQTGDKLRYTEFTTENKLRSYRLSSIEDSPYIKCLLNKANQGATIEQLANTLVEFDGELSICESFEFVEALIDNQLLVHELEPTITGKEFYDVLIEKLRTIDNAKYVYNVLVEVKEHLKSQDSGISTYKKVAELIKEFIPGTSSKDLVQVDMFWESECNVLNKAWVDQMAQQISQVYKLSEKYMIEDIEEFKKQFQNRYENREIPLMEALDPEIGIGYADYSPGRTDINPLSEKIEITKREALDVKWNGLMRYKLSKYTEAIKEKKTEIIIEDADIERLSKGKKIKLPDQFYVMGNLVKGASDLEIILHNLMGPSACELMGRFCSGDRELHIKVKEMFTREKEKYPDIVFAEVIHLPPERIGNILLRPVLREYEIPFLGQSSVDHVNQITVSDLVVSVVDNEVILRSKKLNKRVIPKLTSAHNYSIRNLSTYKFLCDIQYQGLNMGFIWDWRVFANEPFLPRVRYKNIILKKAQWLLNLNDFSFEKNESVNEKIKFFRNKLQNKALPRYVSIEEADNLLLIDTGNDFALELLLDYLIKKKNIIVSEFLQLPEKCIVNNKNLPYTNEVIIPFSNNELALNVSKQRNSYHCKNGKNIRHFNIGDEWLYYKIFCGTKTAERILKDFIPILVEDLKRKNLVDKWFFVRYFNPEPHLRIRFHSSSNHCFWHYVVTEVQKSLTFFIENEWINKIEVDTYKREIERYTDQFIEESESVFFYDSEAVLEIIQCIDENQDGEKQRWLFALQGIDSLLNDFELDLDKKTSFMKILQESFLYEFGSSNALRHHLNDQYRKDFNDIQDAFSVNVSYLKSESQFSIYTRRSALLKGVFKDFQAAQADGQIISSLLSSYIHMFCNRLFLSNHRKNELVLYHYLHKFYQSQLIRRNSMKKAEQELKLQK